MTMAADAKPDSTQLLHYTDAVYKLQMCNNFFEDL